MNWPTLLPTPSWFWWEEVTDVDQNDGRPNIETMDAGLCPLVWSTILAMKVGTLVPFQSLQFIIIIIILHFFLKLLS